MKTLSQFIFEASKIFEGADLHCSNCGDNLGKATENSKKAYCGTCGSTTHNPKGSAGHAPAPKKEVTHGLPNIKMTNHKSDVKPSGKAFNLDVSKSDAHHVSHGNGIYTSTSRYKDHPEYKHLGVKVAHTSINKLSGHGHKWEMGSIEHVKHPDGSETHTLTYRPSNHSWSGGEVKSLKDAVSKTSAMHAHHLKKTGKETEDHGHDVKFT